MSFSKYKRVEEVSLHCILVSACTNHVQV